VEAVSSHLTRTEDYMTDEKKPLPAALAVNLWKPGQSGNPAGGKKGSRLDKALSVFEMVLDVTSDEETLQGMRRKLKAMIEKSPGAYLVKVWLPFVQAMTASQRHEIALIIQDRMHGAASGVAQEQLDALRRDPRVMEQAMALAKALGESKGASAPAIIDAEVVERPVVDPGSNGAAHGEGEGI
jgi:hypothetical protein